jgi:UDP-N-acetylmuramoyl-L-alanyl-D-glutamate--2,6-diaminopimelate ligase
LRLIDLLPGEITQVNLTDELRDRDITGLTADSRAVEPGFLFAALPGTKIDGRSYIDAAIADGAAAILAPEGTEPPREDVAMVTSPDPRAALAHIAAAFYRDQPDTIAAVTGTNGKTSVAHFTRQIWSLLGRQAVSMGTLGLQLPDSSVKPTLTTPDPVSLHADLAELARNGASHVVMEASSHGLDQRRMDGVKLRAAGFTNLSRDHLDYHGTFENYLAAKTRLFVDLLPEDGIAVLNADIPEFAGLSAAFNGETISYGRNGAELKLHDAMPTQDGTHLSLEAFGTRHEIDLPLAGVFQTYNVLCAAGLVIACGENSADVIACLSRLQGVPGRLEFAGSVNGAGVYIDYAHTPDALENVLSAIRPHTSARLSVIFGCGGDRDRGKRPMMGRIAAEHADIAIVTDDNPRSETASAIRQEIMAAAPGAQEIGDRAKAIAYAVSQLNQGDILIIAGKGHETGQIIGDEIRPFDDLLVARDTIAAARGMRS